MNPWRGLKGLPREMWVLVSATFVNRAGTMVLPFLVLYLTRTLHVSGGKAALALTTYGVAALMAMPAAGWLADHAGPLTVMRGSLFCTGALLLMYPLAQRFGSILAITFLFAILNESVRPSSLALVSDLVEPGRRKSAFALSRLAVNLGMSIGPAIGGVLAAYSFRWLFWADGITSVLGGAVLSLAWPKNTRVRAGEAQWDDAGDLGREIEAEAPRLLSTAHPAAELRAFRNPRMLYFLAALIPVQLVFFQFTSTLPLFLVRHLGMPEAIYGTIFTFNTLLIVALEVPLNTAMENWPHGWSLGLGALLYAIGFGSYALVTRTAGVYAAVTIWTFGEMVLMPASSAYAAEIAPKERRGEYMGLYTMSFSVAFATGPWMGAAALERWGAEAVWGAAFLFGTVSAILMSRIGRKA
ncbi:MAG TPA: MFS transporter [Verrucomicrobiae bacterium]|nr:MFS transporter [Verrucomicrobiae bacterium]